MHEAHLVETHKISIPTDSVADPQAAAEVCKLWAHRWLEAHGLDADVGTWTQAGSGRTGAVWSITVGRAASTVPGAGQPDDWTWSARAKDWARSLYRVFGSQRTSGRLGRSTGEDGAEVVSIHGGTPLHQDRGYGIGMDNPSSVPPAAQFFGITAASAHDIEVAPGQYGVGYRMNGPTPAQLHAGEPSGYFRITGPGLPPGGVEGQANPLTGPTAEDIHEALKRGDVMAHEDVSTVIADQRPPWLRRADGWDEDDLGEGVPPGLITRATEQQMRANASDAEARLRRQAALLGFDPNTAARQIQVGRKEDDQ